MELIIEIRLDHDYVNFLNDIKSRLYNTQLRVANSVNIELIKFYWNLGKDIIKIQSTKKEWGSRFLDQLSNDLQTSNPGMQGFSRRSLEYMRLLAMLYPDEDEFTQQPAARLPWSIIQLLLDKFRDDPAVNYNSIAFDL